MHTQREYTLTAVVTFKTPGNPPFTKKECREWMEHIIYRGTHYIECDYKVQHCKVKSGKTLNTERTDGGDL